MTGFYERVGRPDQGRGLNCGLIGLNSLDRLDGMRRFDEFAFDDQARQLYRRGERLHVPDKALLVLSLLTDRPGALVTRQELRQGLWPDDTFVDFDNNLNVAVRRLREALGDSATSPRYIETLPRRGLRFVATLVPDASPRTSLPAEARPAWLRRAAGAAAVVALAWLGLTGHVGRRDPAPTVTVETFRNLSGDATQDHVADGLRAELVAALARQTLLPDAVAGPSRPAFVVRGTTRRDDSGLYVTAELIESRSQTAVWADSFSCPRADLFRIQRQIAGKIGEELAARLAVGRDGRAG